MPLFTGLALGLAALETAGAGIAASAGLGTAAGAAAASGGLAAAGAGFGATLGAGAGLGAAAGATGITAGAATAAGGIAGASAGGLGLGTIATGIGIAGTAASLGAQGLQMQASQQAAQEQQKQEQLRQKQMALDADRQRRDIIRQTQISQAIGINNAGNSGGDVAGSSALTGIVGQNTTNQNYAINSVNQNEAIGNALFASNAAESGYKSEASLFGGFSSIGQQLANNNMQAGRLTKTLFGGT